MGGWIFSWELEGVCAAKEGFSIPCPYEVLRKIENEEPGGSDEKKGHLHL